MTEKQYNKMLCTILEWGCGLRKGTVALARCAALAAQHEEWGESWTPMSVDQEAATLMGKQQHALWNSIDYALRHSRSPRSVAAAITELVEGMTNDRAGE